MASKLAAVAALLVAVVALAEASSHRTTTITTVVVEEGNQGGMSRCREQIERMSLRHCQMYLSQGRPYELALRSVLNQAGREQHLSECCGELQNIQDEECQCEAIRQLMRQQQQEPEAGSEQMEEMMRRARELPRRCNVGGDCRMRAVFV